MDFVSVLWRARAWKALLFSLIALPAGVVYFVLLAVGIGLSIGLLIVVVGLFLAFGVVHLVHRLADFEARTANLLVDAAIPVPSFPQIDGSFWQILRGFVTLPETWVRLAYLLLKLPLGIVSFAVATTGLGFLASVATPLFYTQSWWVVGDWAGELGWDVDTLGGAVLQAVVGLAVFLLLMHVILAIGRFWVWLARAMLTPQPRRMMLA